MHHTTNETGEYTNNKKNQKRIQRIVKRFFVVALLLWLVQITTVTIRQKEQLERLAEYEEFLKENGEIELIIRKPKDSMEVFASEENTVINDRPDILLINKDNPLSETYKPELIKMIRYGVEVHAEIYDPLTEMLKAGEKEGLRFWVASGYRSLERQRELLDEDIEALMRQGWSVSEAYEETIRETMPVGCSEHATGLAVDIVAKDYQMLNERQGQTDEIKWLQENCSQYGFILRYPKGKEEITGVSYESWHFRYVGVDVAKEIMDAGITLEEYLDSTIS